ncbi:MAG: hypothetical protein IJY93_07295 [Clostridia bacterium]|nr:hypothetical protein [Clostridia bacterium]
MADTMKEQIERELEKLRRDKPNGQVLAQRYKKAKRAYVNAVLDSDGKGDHFYGNSQFMNYAAKEACLIYASEVGIRLEE